MHVGRCRGDIAQARHLETAALTGNATDRTGAAIERQTCRFWRADHGNLLIGEQRRRVAFGTACNKRTEHVHAGDFLSVQRLVETMRVLVITAVQRNQ